MKNKIIKYFETMNGEYFYYTDKNIDDMTYHEPTSERDRHYIDVCFKNGEVTRMFDLKEIWFKGEVK